MPASATAKNKSRAGKISAEKRKQNQAQISTGVKQEPTHLHLHKQDSLFTDVNRALPDPKEKPPKPHRQPTSVEIARKEFFDRGKVVLGEAAGGMLQSLLAVKHGNIALARAALEQASTMDNPRQYIGGILRGGLNGKTENAIGGFSGLGAKLRQAVADEERDSFDPAPDR